ncbi:uncharacterized protein LOC142777265 [Rhipicephalus microplus]|uniref:uncharacterized protein LOC142777265 n=1 Tax=Rhipicephalus microplus TaxID=6941 RepID=UPI003F6CF0B3
MVESLDMTCVQPCCISCLVFSRHLYRCVGLILSRKRGARAAPRKEQAPSKLPKLSSTRTARSLCGIENHCKEGLISTLCCSFITEAEVDYSRGTSRCVLCL